MKLDKPLAFAPDLTHLDRAYRAKRSGQSPAEYAASVEFYRRPRKHWLAYLVTAALVVGSILMARA